MVKRIIRKIESDNAILAIDDTIEEKPHSTENEIICWHWDHSQGRNVKGINILNFLYHSTLGDGQDISIPAAFEVIEKMEQYLDILKQHGFSGREVLDMKELRRD